MFIYFVTFLNKKRLILYKPNNKTMSNEKTYIGTYKVVKFFRVSNRRKVLRRGLTLDEAKSLVKTYPDSKRSLVGFVKQFTAEKYYI